MKMVCTSACVFRGDVVRKGAVLEVTEAEMEEYPARTSFAPAMDGGEGRAAPPSRGDGGLVAGLTREQAVMKLYQAGVNVPERISMAKLRERFEETFGAMDAK